ncbi:hypothetical protein [Marinomonas sp. MED121]|uniref:hypothetical protein n=1 Tax=Marinomonas sp. MED121 TaxID=314277 RepID=UPI00055E6153|nr:hypothetical protein [Marinomonas sp. MED121]
MPQVSKILNQYCPRSGKAVSMDSLTLYLGHTVGFCNPRCRDDFRDNQDKCDKDKMYFEVLIKETLVKMTY